MKLGVLFVVPALAIGLAASTEVAATADTGHLAQLEADDAAEGVRDQPIFSFDGQSLRAVSRSVVRAHANSDGNIVYGNGYRALSRPNKASMVDTFHDGTRAVRGVPEVSPNDAPLAAAEGETGSLHVGLSPNGGAALPTMVFGTDNRYRLQNVTSYSTNSFVQIEAPNGDDSTRLALCSGVVYGSNTIVTAGHCLLNDSGTWNWPWKIHRGRDYNYYPYGTCTSTIAYLDAWSANGPAGNDYAVFKMDCSVPGTYGSGLEPVVAINGNVILNTAWVTGYPTTPPSNYPYGTLWEAAGQLVSNTTNTWRYTMDITSGQSGGPTTTACSSYGFGECLVGVISRDQNRLFLSQNVSKRFTSANISFLAYVRDVAP